MCTQLAALFWASGAAKQLVDNVSPSPDAIDCLTTLEGLEFMLPLSMHRCPNILQSLWSFAAETQSISRHTYHTKHYEVVAGTRSFLKGAVSHLAFSKHFVEL